MSPTAVTALAEEEAEVGLHICLVTSRCGISQEHRPHFAAGGGVGLLALSNPWSVTWALQPAQPLPGTPATLWLTLEEQTGDSVAAKARPCHHHPLPPWRLQTQLFLPQ